jgi:hypothetical protein
LIKSKGITTPPSKQKRKAKPEFYRLAAVDVAAIQRKANRLRTQLAKLRDGERLTSILDEIVALLPGGGGE